jgi:hypothetical protein
VSEAWNQHRELPVSAIVHEDVACDTQKVHSVHFRQISRKKGCVMRRWPTIYKDIWVPVQAADHSSSTTQMPGQRMTQKATIMCWEKRTRDMWENELLL